MELKERILLIIKENNLKQKELAAIMGVSESYVSTLLSGRNQNLSTSVAKLIEEKLGYSEQWILLGKEPKFRNIGKNTAFSDTHRRVLMQLETMSDDEIKAVLAFIDTLGSINRQTKE